MITLRKSDDRGRGQHGGWLDSHHTFSFSSYFDPRHMGFRTLRVINEDRITPGSGFGTHPHRDMEIISYVVQGELEHRDSMGTGSVIRPNDVQIMSAGTGVTHSEFNPSNENGTHFLQIWILPDQRNAKPRYDQRTFEDKHNQLRLAISKDGRDNPLALNQDVDPYVSHPDAGQQVTFSTRDGGGIWVQVVKGSLKVNGEAVNTSDGAAIESEASLTIEATDDAEFILFDLA